MDYRECLIKKVAIGRQIQSFMSGTHEFTNSSKFSSFKPNLFFWEKISVLQSINNTTYLIDNGLSEDAIEKFVCCRF
jgi:hypothetical protein